MEFLKVVIEQKCFSNKLTFNKTFCGLSEKLVIMMYKKI